MSLSYGGVEGTSAGFVTLTTTAQAVVTEQDQPTKYDTTLQLTTHTHTHTHTITHTHTHTFIEQEVLRCTSALNSGERSR